MLKYRKFLIKQLWRPSFFLYKSVGVCVFVCFRW